MVSVHSYSLKYLRSSTSLRRIAFRIFICVLVLIAFLHLYYTTKGAIKLVCKLFILKDYEANSDSRVCSLFGHQVKGTIGDVYRHLVEVAEKREAEQGCCTRWRIGSLHGRA